MVLVAVAVAAGVLPTALAEEELDPWASPAVCGDLDTPETGIQGDVSREDQDSGRAGEGYNCGLALVGYHDLGGTGGGDLAWSGDCAYVKGAGGTWVIDVTNPESPDPLFQLQGTGEGSENIDAVATEQRAILITTPGTPFDGPTTTDVWDVSGDCANPQHLGAINFGDYPHNIRLSRDATKVYASFDLKVADISNLADPSTWEVTQYGCDIAKQYHPVHQTAAPTPASPTLCDQFPGPQLSHLPDTNADRSRLYIAGQQHPVYETYLFIVDMTEDPPRLISTLEDSPGHGMDYGIIGGHEYLLHSNEITAAPTTCVPEDQRVHSLGWPAQALLTDIGDEEAPQTVAELHLEINRAEHCPDRLASGVSSSIHYHSINSPDDTRFAMLAMGNSGLRVWDLRDPENLVELAYFNPGAIDGSLDSVGNDAYYDAEQGHIWMATRTGGFWVLEVEDNVREALGLTVTDLTYPRYPNGRPAKG